MVKQPTPKNEGCENSHGSHRSIQMKLYILLFFVLILQKLKRPFPAGWSPEMM